MTRGRRRDRRVYLRSHPILFVLLAATRHREVRRLGRTVLVHDPAVYRHALTVVPLDRQAPGTTGGEAARLAGRGALFDQQGDEHRRARRDTADRLGAAGVARLRPLWQDLLDRRLAGLAGGAEIDLVEVAAEMAGATAAALLDVDVEPLVLAAAAREAASAATQAHLPSLRAALAHLPGLQARAHLPGRRWRRSDDRVAAERLTALVGPGRAAVLAVAAINTTVAALPRAAAWAADDDLWAVAARRPQALADELLRVTAASPLLPRVPAAHAVLPAVDEPRFLSDPGGLLDPTQYRGGGWLVGPHDRLLLITRHASGAHQKDPDADHPAPPQQSHLIFGAGPHTCPGASLARAQAADFLTALAPYRPRVTRRRADRHSALPGWRLLTVQSRP